MRKNLEDDQASVESISRSANETEEQIEKQQNRKELSVSQSV